MFVSLDGTDCAITEPSPFSPKWYSHKLNGPGLRYEVGLSIFTGHIVWIHGPFPAGKYPDIKIAQQRYIFMVEDDEMTLADRGYNDQQYFVNQNYYPESAPRQKVVMARHETVNSRLKEFAVLDEAFHHNINYHGRCFIAVANVVQLRIENGSPLFSVTALL
jgi:hypothetical protein